MSSVTCVPSLLMMPVLSPLAGEAEGAGGGLGQGIAVILETALAPVNYVGLGVVGRGPEAAPAGSRGRAADLRMVRIAFFRSATFVVSVATLSTRAGSVWKDPSSWVCLASHSRFLIPVVRVLISSRRALRKAFTQMLASEEHCEDPVLRAMVIGASSSHSVITTLSS